MKIIVTGDTHNKNKELIDTLKEMERPDLFIHLGDYVGDGLNIAKAIGVDPIIVRGNGDQVQSGFKEEELLEIEGKRLFLTHGHKLSVSLGLKNIFYRAKELDADVAMFAHTHKSLIEVIDGISIFNPGSPSFPRGFSSKKTFVIMEINKDEKIDIKHIEI